jgi:hypothetical protein
MECETGPVDPGARNLRSYGAGGASMIPRPESVNVEAVRFGAKCFGPSAPDKEKPAKSCLDLTGLLVVALVAGAGFEPATFRL